MIVGDARCGHRRRCTDRTCGVGWRWRCWRWWNHAAAYCKIHNEFSQSIPGSWWTVLRMVCSLSLIVRRAGSTSSVLSLGVEISDTLSTRMAFSLAGAGTQQSYSRMMMRMMNQLNNATRAQAATRQSESIRLLTYVATYGNATYERDACSYSTYCIGR